MPESRSPTLGEVINRAIARGQAELRVSMPCRVNAYDAGKQTVDVQPLIADLEEGENGEQLFSPLPVVTAVPVHFPAGGSMRITFPVAAGDTGMLIICDRSIDGWTAQGGLQQPADARRHHLSDSWFEPGVSPNGRWKAASADHITLGDDGQAGDFAATANRVLAQLQAIVTAFNGHTHVVSGTDTTTGNPIAGTAAAPVPMGAPTAPASATVEILG